MPSYSAITSAVVRDIKAREDALPIRNEACRSRFYFHPAPAAKTCLFFHGFTAGPYQFVPMAESLFRAGYNVLIPRMPGHGLAGDWGKDNPPPLPTKAEDYQKFALQWLQLAQTLGGQIVVGGLSGGGTLTGWLAVERPQVISRAILYAAFLSSSSKVIDLFVRNLDSYNEWVNPKPEAVRYGYNGFMIPALRVFLLMGTDILKRSRRGPIAPTFAISSESDIAVGNHDHRTLFESGVKYQPKCWYQRFDRVLDIPHTMMTQEEGNNYQNLLIAMTKAYIESDLTWSEVEDIGYCMTRGKTFDIAVSELNLGQKVSRDMPTMMTMVDKRAIAIARGPRSRGDR
jgi:esterase/lipase